MAKKYHITDAGMPRPCNATKQVCKYGEDKHYATRAEARLAIEKENSSLTLAPVVKKEEKPKPAPVETEKPKVKEPETIVLEEDIELIEIPEVKNSFPEVALTSVNGGFSSENPIKLHDLTSGILDDTGAEVVRINSGAIRMQCDSLAEEEMKHLGLGQYNEAIISVGIEAKGNVVRVTRGLLLDGDYYHNGHADYFEVDNEEQFEKFIKSEYFYATESYYEDSSYNESDFVFDLVPDEPENEYSKSMLGNPWK